MVSGLAASPKRVLILDSFGRDVAPYAAAVTVFRTTLAGEFGEPIDFYDTSLDLARFAEPRSEGLLVDFLEQRFTGRPVDLVVSIGAPAARFAALHRQRLFTKTPVLYACVDPRRLPPESLQTNAALVTLKNDLPGMIEDVLQLRPDTTNIVAVIGGSALEQFWKGECAREWQGFTPRVSFSWLDTLSLTQMLGEVQKLPPRSFIVFLMLLVDAEGVPHNGDEVLKSIHAVANAPVYSYFRSQFGLGGIGGRLYPEEVAGALAARAAIRILRGERPEDIPQQIVGPSSPVYDGRELKRWGIRPSRLPAGSVIEFRDPTFWQHYRGRIVAGLVLLVLQSALIVGLLVNRVKRRQEEAAATLIADLSARFINLAPGAVDGEIEDAQRRVCGFFRLDLGALWQVSAESPEVINLTHIHRPSGGPPIPENMNAAEHFPWCSHEVRARRVFALASLDEAPAEAARDVAAFRHYGVKSNLTIPLSAGEGPLLGALFFGAMRQEQTWSEPMVGRLLVVAQIFANALARKHADIEMRGSEARLSLAAAAAALGLWSLDLATHRFWLTDKTRELFEFAPDEVVTFNRFLSAVHPADQAAVRQALADVVRAKGETQVEYRIVRSDGSLHWMLSRGRVRCNPSGQPDQLVGVSMDVTPRRRTEEALRAFSARLISAQEEERSRLARELHDDITQRLARLAIDVGRDEGRASTGLRDETARSVRDELIRLSEDVHALSYRLHPSILEDLGLAAALKAEVERVGCRGSVPIEVDLRDIPERVSSEVALCLFRIAQEALRNVVRHAGAQTTKLSLRGWDDGLQLAVQDDGCGFDPGLQHDQPRLGLASMRERAHLVGGELDIESAPGKGTIILAWVPLEKRAEA